MIKELKDVNLYLKKNGIENSSIETEYIFCHLFNYKRIDLYTKDTSLNEFQQQNLHKVIEKRVEGEPLQYILGKCEFYGFEFKVKKGVFIPRPETEILVDTVLKMGHPCPNILDLCTGSGNIAISLTKAQPYYKIFASDISKMALRLAKENAILNSINNSIEFREGDLFNPWQDKKGFFDAIVCNPPYIKTDDLEKLPPEVKNEPQEALDGGKDGLSFYKRILEDAQAYLVSNGYIFFEINPNLANSVKEILLDNNFCDIKITKDYNSLDRVISAQRR